MAVTLVEASVLFDKAKERLEQVKIILDIGCGIQPQRLVRPRIHICCEPFIQYVDHLQKVLVDEKDRDYIVLNARWDQIVEIFPAKSIDTVILQDVIEHLEKEQALELLGFTEKIARRQIAVFTPLGFMPQHHIDGKDAWGLDGGHWQEHRSGWQPEDFGDTWDVFVSKEFHFQDSLGNVLVSPYGAFWAIKTLPAEDNVILSRKLSKRQLVYALVDKILSVGNIFRR